MRRIIKLWMLIGVVLLSACQHIPTVSEATLTPYVVVETETLAPDISPEVTEAVSEPTVDASPTLIPEYPVITADLLNTLQVVASAAAESPVSLSWSDDSTRIGVLSVNGFSIYSAVNGALLKSISFTDPYRLLDASISREVVAVTTDQLTIEFRSMDTGEVVSSLTTDELFQSGSFNSDGFEFLTTSSYDISAQIWDIETGQLVKTVTGFETAAPVYSARFSTTGTSLIWTARATVQVYDLQMSQFGAILGHEEFVSSSDLAPNGRLLAAAAAGTINGEYQPLIRLWDAFGGQILGDLANGDSIANHVSFSPDGTLLLVAQNTDTSVWQVQSLEQIWKLPSSGSPMRDARFSPDAKALATVDGDGTLQILRAVQY